MADREKVIKGLECCANPEARCSTKKCPYFDIHGYCWVKLEQDALELLKEIKPYGGFIEFPDAADEITGYKAIVEHMLKAGILKVEKQEAPMLTRYNWAIKAVKWDDEN